MKIAFYIHHTTIADGGIFTYTIAILKLLIKSPKIDKIVIITTNEVSERLNNFDYKDKLEFKIVDRNKTLINLMLKIWFALYAVIVLLQYVVPGKKFYDKLKLSLAKLNPYQKIVDSSDVDILHIPIQHSPVQKIKTPIIITMHDIQEYHFPEYFSLIERLRRFIKNDMSILDSEHIIVSFDHVKNDIIKHFDIEEKKISICPPPFAEDWFLEKKEVEWNEVKLKYNLKDNYILYPAATWEHKNHKTLLEALKIIRDEGLEIDLVCTGRKMGYYKNISNQVEELMLKDVAHFLGIVPEEDLITLYKNSSLVVIPTLYEAGSAPLYEAMRYKVPVICSNVTSLPATINNEDFIFDPTDVHSLVEKIKMGLENEDFRARNVQNSKQRMEYFERIDYSRNFINVYRNLITPSQS
jgi:glycosyltransferase involved in cell wall biosynthesis